MSADTYHERERSGSLAPDDVGVRALVVEDDPGDRWFLSEILRRRGHTVVACETAELAWKAFQEDPLSLILLDLVLPGMDGTDLCRLVREDPRGADTFILMVTGTDHPRALRDMLEAGADDFIRKPVPPSLLEVRLAIAESRMRDRTERQRTRDALEAKTRELANLFENLPEVFFSVDLAGDRLIQISPTAHDLFGYDPARLKAEPSLWKRLLLPPAGPGDHPWADLVAGKDGDGTLVRQYEVVRADGSHRWVRASVSLEQAEEGLLRAHGFAVDTTSEARARAELAARNKELAALQRIAELSLSAPSPGEAYAPVLAEVAKATGFPLVALEHLDRASDRLVMTAAHGFPPQMDTPLEVPLHQTLSGLAVERGRPVLEHDVRSRREHTHEALVALDVQAWAAFPLTTGGSVVGTLTLANPRPAAMNDRWVRLGSSLAATLATLVERLEAEEAVRNSEARLRSQAAELQQANQELEAFAYSVSHDLRAPLRTMQGFAHALLQDHGNALNAEARDYARRIIASGRLSERLITDLLSYSRLTFEKLELKPVDLASVVDAAREQMHADLAESKAHLEVQRPLYTVMGNHTALVQVVVNLLSNAVKFVPPERTGEVRIHAEKRDDKVRLWVEDNGIGVPEGQEERIFRVFERLVMGGDQPGTGIGLALVRRAMQRVDGECGVERLPEGGSAFWIEAHCERARRSKRKS